MGNDDEHGFLRDVKVATPAKVTLHPPADLVAAVVAAEQALAEHRASGGEFTGPDPERMNELKQVYYEAAKALCEAEYSETSALLTAARPRLDPVRQVLMAAYADYVAVAQEVDML